MVLFSITIVIFSLNIRKPVFKPLGMKIGVRYRQETNRENFTRGEDRVFQQKSIKQVGVYITFYLFLFIIISVPGTDQGQI
jgi:hypothetical protein